MAVINQAIVAMRDLRQRRTLRLLLLAGLALSLLVGAGGAGYWWRLEHSGQAMRIHDNDPRPATGPWAKPSPRDKVPGPPFITSVSADGRYLVDQYGEPFLVKGDSPWALMTRLSPQQADSWFTDRERKGFNAAIVSLIGATANGGPNDDGTTFDGLNPFVAGNILTWQEPYWNRVTRYLELAAQHGITVMLYPVDGWTIGHSFVPKSIQQCHQFGAMVAKRFRQLPNIVWMSGGDYFPHTDDLARGSDVDHCIDAMMRAIRASGDDRPFSIQLGYDKSVTTENPYWAQHADWNFVYTYYPTYKAVLDAYRWSPPIPAILGEANYEGENNQPDTKPTTNETLRRQLLWAMTSGAAGSFVGSQDWKFKPSWEQRLSTRSLSQLIRLHELFSGLPWWRLVPDTTSRLVIGGRGKPVTTDRPMDVLDNEYVTASRTADGHVAVIYVPTQRTITVNPAEMASGTRAAWIDPASGSSQAVTMSSTFTTPGKNSEGNGDWILLFQPSS